MDEPTPITKAAHLQGLNRAWNNTGLDEPVFVICARDILAVPTILAWIESGSHAGVPPDKLRAARQHLDAFVCWQQAHGTVIPA